MIRDLPDIDLIYTTNRYREHSEFHQLRSTGILYQDALSYSYSIIQDVGREECLTTVPNFLLEYQW